MDFDWNDFPYDPAEAGLTRRDIEESFEDPFGLRLMGDVTGFRGESRFFLLGRSVSGKALFSVFWTDGKKYRVISSRQMTDEEEALYSRKNSELFF